MLKTYIKLMPGLPLSSASRNKREMAAAREAGYRVVAIYYEPDYVPEAELAGVELVPFKMRPLKGKHSILSNGSISSANGSGLAECFMPTTRTSSAAIIFRILRWRI